MAGLGGTTESADGVPLPGVLCLEGYLAGLAEAGWTADPQQVRFSMLTTLFYRYLYGGGLGELWSIARDERNHPMVAVMFGVPSFEVVIGALASATAFYREAYQQISLLPEAILMSRPAVLAPLRYRDFRLLWAAIGDVLCRRSPAGAGASLADCQPDRLLGAAVGAIGVGSAAIPQLLMPLRRGHCGPAQPAQVADRDTTRRIALAAAIIGALVATGLFASWQIYVWAFFSGTLWLLARPAYKVVLTESVPVTEVRPAVAINSMTETILIMLIAVGGSVLLDRLGLVLGFALNAASYLIAAGCLWWAPRLNKGQVRLFARGTPCTSCLPTCGRVSSISGDNRAG